VQGDTSRLNGSVHGMSKGWFWVGSWVLICKGAGFLEHSLPLGIADEMERVWTSSAEHGQQLDKASLGFFLIYLEPGARARHR
jgi:hypothetical protein